MMTNNNHKNIDEEIKCTDNDIWYMILMKVMCSLIKVCKKKKIKIVKREIKNKKMVILIKL